jgi:ADP-ribose pyrophosphatase YjhB (NUDIX family)
MDELVFQYVELRPEVSHPIKALRDGREKVLVLLRGERNQWILGKKAGVYPENVSRLIGGKADDDEGTLPSVLRELQEETGIQAQEEKLIPLIHAEVHGPDATAFSTFVFYYATTDKPVAGSDVTDFSSLSDNEYHQLVLRMNGLSPFEVIADDAPATWADWGRVWGPIHVAAMERVRELGLQ